MLLVLPGLVRGGRDMKSKSRKLFIVLAMGALVLSACQLSTGTVKSATTGQGTVTFSIPRINPYIADSQQTSSKGATSKAFAYVDAVEVDFYQNDEIVKAVMLGSAHYDETTNSITGSVTLASGTYDRMTVSVFNSAVSDTEPVVAGQTEEAFVVPVNATLELSLVLYPCAPVLLEDSVLSAEATLNLNGEKWYSFYAPDTKTKVTVLSNEGNFDAYIFGPDGKVLDGVSGSDPEKSVIFDTTTFDMPYYICLVGRTADSKGQVKYGTGIDYGSVNIAVY